MRVHDHEHHLTAYVHGDVWCDGGGRDDDDEETRRVSGWYCVSATSSENESERESARTKKTRIQIGCENEIRICGVICVRANATGKWSEKRSEDGIET